MAYSQMQADENKKMSVRARELLVEGGYDPANTPEGGYTVHREFLQPFIEYATEGLQLEFPDVSPARIAGRVWQARVAIDQESGRMAGPVGRAAVIQWVQPDEQEAT